MVGWEGERGGVLELLVLGSASSVRVVLREDSPASPSVGLELADMGSCWGSAIVIKLWK